MDGGRISMLLLHNLSMEHGGGNSLLLFYSVSMHVHIYSQHGWWKNLNVCLPKCILLVQSVCACNMDGGVAAAQSIDRTWWRKLHGVVA
eukprot:1021408-Karenia_brevis.AAC.1